MALPNIVPIERRALRGTARSLSALTISVDPPAVAPPAADARTVALLRRARERGVTSFDVARARFPERAETLVATAFPVPDPELSLVVGRSVESLAREPAPGAGPTSRETLTGALDASLEQTRRRIGTIPISIVEWDPGGGDPPEGSKIRGRLSRPRALTRAPSGRSGCRRMLPHCPGLTMFRRCTRGSSRSSSTAALPSSRESTPSWEPVSFLATPFPMGVSTAAASPPWGCRWARKVVRPT